jgi:hypothetical protein
MNGPARLRALPLLVVAAALAAGACSRTEPAPAAPEPAAVENARLEIAVRPLPEGFEVAENLDDRLRFDVLLDGTAGSATLMVGPPTPSGVNLVDSAKSWGEAAAAAAGGRFFGGNQLGTPFGPAYTVRALVDAGRTEERRVYLLHPGGGDRLLTLVLRYPAGDAAVANGRLRQAMDLVGALAPFRDAGAGAPAN